MSARFNWTPYYFQKREEYLRAGVLEYWILDPEARLMRVHLRAGDVWDEIVLADDAEHGTNLLPGLKVRVGDLLGTPGNPK